MKRQGFTLIELLAVIVILAIVALIATPTILGVIEKARKGSAEQSALGYIDAVEKQIAINELGDNKIPYETQSMYTTTELKNTYQVTVKGTTPDGKIEINSKGNVVKGALEINTYYVYYNQGKVTASKEKTEDYIHFEEQINYEEAILNGAIPNIKGDLVAVTIENDGTVKKASLKSKWYSYENKEWANAVILKDKTITYSDNDIIPEENIESYFVWIPKYQYKLFDLGNYESAINSKPTTSIAHTIEIVFGTATTSDKNDGECTTPMTSGATGNCKVGDYMTHPAFLIFNTNGIWVGKFETTGSTNEITVKPNIAALRNQTVKTFFELFYNYNRNLDSHMMKNTEWGAVAHLSHSKYGINKEVNINNNSNYLTGYSATEEADQANYPGTTGTTEDVTKPYNTETGYKASTTGNITGIYDMSGGVREYVSSYIEGNFGSSGFDTTTIQNYDSKYFDVYKSDSTMMKYSNRILGDATGEMGPFYQYLDGDEKNRKHNNWYEDSSSFVNSSYPWFDRSGNYSTGVLTGQFYFNTNTGALNNMIGSRLVLNGK